MGKPTRGRSLRPKNMANNNEKVIVNPLPIVFKSSMKN
jgi:hypothetical protein